MKKYILTITFVLLFSLIQVRANEENSPPCAEADLNIYIEADCVDQDSKSTGEYPDCRQDSYLQIKSIEIRNDQDCSVYPMIFYLAVTPEYYDSKSKESEKLSFQFNVARPMQAKTSYKLIYKKEDLYCPMDDSERCTHLIEMYHLGELTPWEITPFLELYEAPPQGGPVFNAYVNGNSNKNFQVHSRTELEELSLSNSSFWVAFFVAILATLNIIFLFQNRSAQKREERVLKEIKRDLEKLIEMKKK